MSRIRVVVTQDDIDKGVTVDIWACPVALALQRVGFPEANTDGEYWYPGSGYSGRTRLTKRISDWINDFDDEKPVHPVTFLIEGPALSDEV